MRKILLLLIFVLSLPIVLSDAWNLDGSSNIYYQTFNNVSKSGNTYTDIALSTVDQVGGTYGINESGISNQSIIMSSDAYAYYSLASTSNIWQTSPTDTLATVDDGAISLWIKPNSAGYGTLRTIFSITPTSTTSPMMQSQLMLQANNTLLFRSIGIAGDSTPCKNGEMNIFSSIVIANDTWTHVVLNMNSAFSNGKGGYTYTINGANDTNVATTIGGVAPLEYSFLEDSCGGAIKSPAIYRTFGATIQASPSWTQFFTGEIDELSIWDTPLTVPVSTCDANNCSQACALYNDGSGYNPYSDSDPFPECNVNIQIDVQEIITGNTVDNFNYTIVTTADGFVQAGNDSSSPITLTGYGSGTFKVLIQHADYMNYSQIDSFTNETYGTVELYQAIMNISAINIKTGSSIDNFAAVVTDGIYSNGYTATAGNITALTLTGDYTVNGYTTTEEVSQAVSSMVLGETRNVTLQMGFNLSLQFINEYTLGAFNVTSPDTIQVWAECPSGRDETYTINKSNPIVPITCAYTGFNVRVYLGADSYVRRYIAKDSFDYSEDVYLIDFADNVTINYVEFIVDDILNQYNNKSLYIKKRTVDGDITIHSAKLDSENKVTAFLLQNNEYFLELHSSNYPTINLGTFIPYTSGTRNIRLFNYGMGPNAPSYYTATWQIGKLNDTAFLIYNDSGYQTNSIVWRIYNNSLDDSSVVSTITVLNASTPLGNYINTYNTSNLTGSIFSKLTVNFIDRQFNYTVDLTQQSTIDLNITNVFGQKIIDWALIIILSIIFLYGTISTTHIISLFASGLGFLLVLFGWLSLPIELMAVCVLFSLIAVIIGGGGKQI